ncbi:unnamed protein product [Leptosia nina]|uniref:Uncharacterized protein n=1 Tax=Leptosia nina TaxID=320188 RepID=A0AAV1ISH4_9NEOP
MIYLRSMLLYIFLYVYCYHSVVSLALVSANLKKQNETGILTTLTLMSIQDSTGNNSGTEMLRSLTRVKKASDGEGKFTEAAKMDQLKLLRLMLQNFKNTWSDSYIGGSHPMHPNVPKAFSSLFLEKIIKFFFPPVGEDAIKQ